MSNAPIPPMVAFLSFMVVAAGYMLSNFFWMGSLIMLTASESLFPDAHRIWRLAPQQFKEVLYSDPYAVVPIPLFWCVFSIGVVGSMVAGFSVVRSAPFSKFGHVIFTATLTAISWLQQLLSGKSPDEFRWMILLSMMGMAGAMLFGGKIGFREDPPPKAQFISE